LEYQTMTSRHNRQDRSDPVRQSNWPKRDNAFASMADPGRARVANDIESSPYRVEKGIPLPPRKTSGSYRSKYPFTRMAIGDSFVVADSATAKIRTAASWAAIRHGMKFSCRKTDDGIRVWRTR
jgi:hypothetical protein